MELFRRVKIALILFIAVVISGIFGFWALEPEVNSLLDSFFFTLITVTTVGYGDIVPITTPGKVWAIVIILTGVGSAMVVLQSTFEMLVGRRIREELNLPDKKTEKQNHNIICGWGKIGKAIARHLKTEEQTFVIVEHDESKVERIMEAGLSVIAGDARQEDVTQYGKIEKSRSR